MPDPIKKSSWNIQQAKVKAEKDAKLKLLLQDKEFLNNLKEQSKKNNKNKEVNIKPSDATKVVTKSRPELTSKSARNKTDKEIAQEREAKIQASVEAQKTPYTKENWRQQLAAETVATGDKLRRRLEPNFFDDYLNPAAMIGSMASNLGQAPLQAQQSDSYMPYVTSIGMPLAVGAMAGLGTQNTGQFVNNVANPLAGTGDLVNNLGNKYLPNAYKLNPFAFKPKNNMLYRGVAEAGFNDAIESGIIRTPKGSGFGDEVFTSMDFEIAKNYSRGNNPMGYKVIKNRDGSFNVPEININDKSYVAEIPKTLIDDSTQIIGNEVRFNNPISNDNVKFYKEDWLQGYKQVEVPKPTSNFKSEINWGNWNKEIPDNSQLMKEYNAIEQQVKANGIWMKNPDGSAFNGTPNQLPEPEPFLHLDVNTPQSINLNRAERAGKNVYKETLEEGNLRINKRGGTPENPKTITIKTKTGAIQATQNPDGSYMFHNAVDSKIDAGKAMLELNKHLPKKPTIFETSSMSTDSYTNLLKIGKNKDWKSSFEGFSALNDSNKNVNFLDDLLKWKNRGANAAFVSEKTAIEAQRRMNSYLNKLGYDESANILQRNGEWQMEIPNYRVQRNYQQGGYMPVAGATYLATQDNKQQGGKINYSENEKKFLEELARLKLI